MMRWDTPVGSYEIVSGNHGVSSVSLLHGDPDKVVPAEIADVLNEHLHGRTSSLRLDLQGLRPLAQLTLAKLLEIPYGEVRPYAWVAREIGHPTAVRAVASAVANNPLPLLIPCHRVVRSDGHLGEFSLGGPDKKREILAFEGVDLDRLENLARRKVRFLADKSDDTYHLPTCKLIRDVQRDVVRELHTVEEAVDGHLDACRRCRPI